MKNSHEEFLSVTKNLLFAAVVMQGILTGFFQHVVGIETNANLFVLFTWIIIFMIGIMRRERYRLRLSNIILFIIVILAYVLSKYIFGRCQFYPILIVFYALVPIFVSTQDIDIEKVLRYIIYLSLVSLPYLDVLFAYQYEGFLQASMGNSYSVATIVIAFLIHFKYYRNQAGKILKIVYIYDLYLMIKLLITGNRGAILSVFVCIVILVMNSIGDDNRTKTKNVKQNIIIFVAAIVIVIVVMNLSTILQFVYNVLSAMDVNVPSFILKSVNLMEHTGVDLDNGRSKLYTTIWEFICKEPILGYGIGSLSTYTVYPWAHNYLMQFWFEGGIFFFIFALIITIVYVCFLLDPKSKEKSQFVLVVLLFCECIPRYLISNDPWRGTAVWMFIGFGLMFLFQKVNFKDYSYSIILKK